MADARNLDLLEEYDMNNKKRGLALIFNHEMFDNNGSRRGSSSDKEHLIERFKEMDFDVQCHDDLRKENVLCELDKAAKASHVDADCFVCVFLSHGEKDYIWAYEDKISIEEITDKFNGDNCKSLVGKPKIFIIQACRGQKYDNAVTPMGVDDDKLEVEDGGVYTLPAGADFLMCYSVAKGYYAFRHTINGSWYIQDLCETLRKYRQSLEFTELLTLVNSKVSKRIVPIESSKNPKAIGKKQIPCFVSMLTKMLYFKDKI